MAAPGAGGRLIVSLRSRVRQTSTVIVARGRSGEREVAGRGPQAWCRLHSWRRRRPRRAERWRSERLAGALLALALVGSAWAVVLPGTVSAAPSITVTDPPRGTTTTVAGSRYRLGWQEQPSASSSPITKRTVRQYQATTSGSCSKATYALAWTNTSANRPLRYPLSGLAPGTCYYWKITLTDTKGYSVTARTGYLKPAKPADPQVAITFPVPGAHSDAPPAETYTLRWTELAGAGVASRTVSVETAAVASGRTCTGVTWSPAGTLDGGAGSLALGSLASGACYRYTVTLTTTGGASATATSGPLLITNAPPRCLYGDPLTTYRGDANWRRTLADTTYRLAKTYVPGDLVYSSGITGLNPNLRIRKIAKADLRAMADAARAAGAPIDIASAFRSYSTQKSVFASWVNQVGWYKALLASARAAHSEHQLGVTIDFKSYGGGDPTKHADWATTKAGAWMAAHAWKYGWLMSYPKGTRSKSCYQYEPWHYRYYGRELAKAIRESGLTPREYLWRSGSLAPGA